MIPYGRHSLDEEDIQAVVDVLRNGLLTGGPMVTAFEQGLAHHAGIPHAVALSSGTAALHAAYHALGLGVGDEVIVPAITFVATANALLYCGAKPVFADIDPATLLIDPISVESLITPDTKAIVAVDYAGQPCDYDALRMIAERHGLYLIADACHSLGASYKGRPVGSLAHLSCFSFHPVKPITTGEGGAVVTADSRLADRVRQFRNHGLDSDFAKREQAGGWEYDMVELGCNYRLTDIQCALGLSQLNRLPEFICERRDIADQYDQALSAISGVTPLSRMDDREHGYHLYVVKVDGDRVAWFRGLREQGIGVNVHYKPVYLHSYYQDRGYQQGLCPRAERAYSSLLTLPLYLSMKSADLNQVIKVVQEISLT